VLSNTTDLTKKIGYNSLNYGFDIQNNYVQSTASQNTTSRYADGGSTMNLISAYAQYKKLYGKESNYVSTGIRYNKTILSASFKDTSTYKLPFNEINTNNNAVTASLGWKTKVNKNWTISTSISSGFRSPNVDDITKVFEKSGYVTVPNQNLKPEYSYNAEANVNAKIAKTSWTFSTYYTLLKDAIVKSPYSLNGQDSLFYDGEFFPIIANTNTQEANIYGVYTKMKWEISKNWLFANTLNKTIGQNISNNTPLDHIPPLFVKSEMQWQKKNNRISFYAMYNDWKKANQYSLNGSDNFNEATTDGNPAWWTINAQISSQLNSSLKILVAIENILDVHYKTYSSGISSPGRNFIISLNASF